MAAKMIIVDRLQMSLISGALFITCLLPWSHLDLDLIWWRQYSPAETSYWCCSQRSTRFKVVALTVGMSREQRTRNPYCRRETARCRCKFRYAVLTKYKQISISKCYIGSSFITIDGQVAYLSQSQWLYIDSNIVIRATWYKSSSDGTNGPCYQ